MLSGTKRSNWRVITPTWNESASRTPAKVNACSVAVTKPSNASGRIAFGCETDVLTKWGRSSTKLQDIWSVFGKVLPTRLEQSL